MATCFSTFRLHGRLRVGLGLGLGQNWRDVGQQGTCPFFIFFSLLVEAESSVSLYHQNGMPSAPTD